MTWAWVGCKLEMIGGESEGCVGTQSVGASSQFMFSHTALVHFSCSSTASNEMTLCPDCGHFPHWLSQWGQQP